MKQWLIVGLSIGILACSSGQIPSNAVLNVSPQSRTFEIQNVDAERCKISGTFYQDIPLLFSLVTADGSPIGEADLTVIADFTSNTFSGKPVIELYDDINGNGVIDEDTELVSGPDSVGFVTETSRYGGERLVWVRVNLSCPFSAEIFAFSSTVSTSANITVKALGDEPTDDGNEDPAIPDENEDPIEPTDPDIPIDPDVTDSPGHALPFGLLQ